VRLRASVAGFAGPAALFVSLLITGGLLFWSAAHRSHLAPGHDIKLLLPQVDCTSSVGDTSCAMGLAKVLGAVLGGAAKCDDLAPRAQRIRDRAKELLASVAVDGEDLEASSERLANTEEFWRRRHQAGLERQDCAQIRDGIMLTEQRLWLR
jgi:hypothetical protein